MNNAEQFLPSQEQGRERIESPFDFAACESDLVEKRTGHSDSGALNRWARAMALATVIGSGLLGGSALEAAQPKEHAPTQQTQTHEGQKEKKVTVEEMEAHIKVLQEKLAKMEKDPKAKEEDKEKLRQEIKELKIKVKKKKALHFLARVGGSAAQAFGAMMY